LTREKKTVGGEEGKGTALSVEKLESPNLGPRVAGGDHQLRRIPTVQKKNQKKTKCLQRRGIRGPEKLWWRGFFGQERAHKSIPSEHSSKRWRLWGKGEGDALLKTGRGLEEGEKKKGGKGPNHSGRTHALVIGRHRKEKKGPLGVNITNEWATPAGEK